jgi:23S rRNA (guanosine2251-2'-O)-methyltransferase
VAVTAAVARVAVGAAETVPVARVSNLAATLRSFKEQGLTAVGLAPASGSPIWSADLRAPLVIVAGGEERGLRRLVSETCDALVSIPMRGRISSLNVSVALGIACYEVLRQRTVP